MRLSRMFNCGLLVAVAAVAVTIGSARAATTLSTGIGNDSGPVACYAANVGTASVRVNSMKFIAFDGNEVPTTISGNCNFPGNISPGLACEIGPPVTTGPLRCAIEVATTGGAKYIRGTLWFFGTGHSMDAR